MNMSATECQIS